MNLISKIESRVKELEVKLQLLETEMENEMKKPWTKRAFYLLEFLYKERAVYVFSLKELKTLIQHETLNKKVQKDTINSKTKGIITSQEPDDSQRHYDSYNQAR